MILHYMNYEANTTKNLVGFEKFWKKIVKTKFKKSDDQTHIDKYRVAANITEYHIISKLIFL